MECEKSDLLINEYNKVEKEFYDSLEKGGSISVVKAYEICVESKKII